MVESHQDQCEAFMTLFYLLCQAGSDGGFANNYFVLLNIWKAKLGCLCF